jgi:photosystem II stability/assembly factor-like uncharacterized protein
MGASELECGSRPGAVHWWTCGALICTSALGCVIPISSNAVGSDGGSSTLVDGGATVVDGSAPAPQGIWTNVTGSLPLANSCLSVTTLWAQPNVLLSGVATASASGLWSGTSPVSSWQELGAGSGSAAFDDSLPVSVVFDPQNPSQYWVSSIYGTGSGVYQTANNGTTFAALGGYSSHHCDLVSVDFTDPMRQTLLAGGHEEAQTLRLSTNGGMTWTNIGAGLPSDTFCTLPLIIDSKTYLVGCNYYLTSPTGIYRTTNSGTTWTQVSTSGGGSAPMRTSDGSSIYWATAGVTGGMTRSIDNGQTWTDVVKPGVISPAHPVELPGGKIATVGGELYGTQYVLVSSDQGATWSPASAAIPVSDVKGLAYLSQEDRFYIWNQACADGGPLDAVMRFDPANPDE